jgi:glycosyltransferase involved in cell wall biosynthesis
MEGRMKVSCIMPTADRRRFVPVAIEYFLAQDYPDKELIVLDDGADAVADLIPDDPQIRYLRLEVRQRLGAKRNIACAAAGGELIAHWDDDDWYAPARLRRQVDSLLGSGADICGLDRVLFFDPVARGAFEYVYRSRDRPWVYGATLCYRKSFWLKTRFAAIDVGEDTRFVFSSPGARINVLPDNNIFVGIMHQGNTSPKPVRDPRWQPRPVAVIEAVTGAHFHRLGAVAAPTPAAPSTGFGVVPAAPSDPEPAHAAREVAAAAMRIAVGIRVDTEPERLTATLEHLRRYTAHPIEILLLADGPDLSMQRVLAEWGDLPQSATAQQLGAAACFNRLLRHGNADLMIFMEAGALVGPGWLEPLLAALAADPRHGLAGPSTNRSWNVQAAFAGSREADIAPVAAAARAHFADAFRTLEPLHCLADFCYAVRREVVDAIGGADETYAAGPCWEMDYTIRAARAGFRAVWAQGSFVYRRPASARRQHDEDRLFDASRRRYQDKFCRLRLTGQRADYARHCRGDGCRQFAPADLIELRMPLSDAAGPTRDPDPPLVSCIMPTRNRGDWVQQAIRYFQRQDFQCQDFQRQDSARLELVIIDDGTDLGASLPRDPRIRYVRLDRRQSIGAKRNLACTLARGSIIVHWDDDDWYAPTRIRAQVAPLLSGQADITALTGTRFFDLSRWQFWSCTEDLHRRLFVLNVHGGTLAYRRAVFEQMGRFPDRSLAEDAAFLKSAVARGARLAPIAGQGHFLYVRHDQNAWSFRCGHQVDSRGWNRIAEPEELAGDRAFYLGRAATADRPPREPSPAGANHSG